MCSESVGHGFGHDDMCQEFMRREGNLEQGSLVTWTVSGHN